MGQVSAKLRKVVGGYSHWCPGCEAMHIIWTETPATVQWTFDGNLTAPTFNPSVRVTYNGKDAGQDRGDGRRAPSACCHYHLHAGVLKFCPDSTHEFAGQSVPLPDLPAELQDLTEPGMRAK